MKQRSASSEFETSPLISCIEINKLFNIFSYRLEVVPSFGPESGKLMLLYGNNGSGKTTILNLIYHLLHPEPYGGHRTFIGKTPFKEIRLHILDNIVISAVRPKDAAPGPYEILINRPGLGKSGIRYSWTSDSKQKELHESDYKKYCDFLAELGLSVHYLRDSRRVGDTKLKPRASYFVEPDLMSERAITIRDIQEQQETQVQEKLVQSSVSAAIQWFRQRALQASNKGYLSVNTIYSDLINRIVSQERDNSQDNDTSYEKLVLELIKLKEKNSSFSRFGLTPELDIAGIVNDLKAANQEHRKMLGTVLKPFLDAHSARLTALEELRTVMCSFIRLLSDFYSHKEVILQLETGLKIRSESGQTLDISQLSSGEKQLLLLFCNAISSRQEKSILMIDEPEISLNVRWQRDLIPSLLECKSGTAFQIVLATHSVELLSRYRDSVTPLDVISNS